jgi:hypothetical protein
MAVTNNGNRIVLGAAADAVTGRMKIQAIVLDHTAAITCVLQDTASKEIASFRTTATELSKQLTFPCGLWVEGIKASTLSAGQVTIYLE